MTYDVLTQQNARKTLQRLTGIEWSTWQYLNRNYNKEQFLSDEDYVKGFWTKKTAFCQHLENLSSHLDILQQVQLPVNLLEMVD